MRLRSILKSLFMRFQIGVLFGLSFAEANKVDYVNILGGTDSRNDFSRGNTLPLMGIPWGFNTYAPLTSTDPTYKSWWFHPNDRIFYGIRLTHQPSPWIGDYGHLIIKPSMVTTPQLVANDDPNQYSGYNPLKSIFTPYYFATDLIAYGTAEKYTHIQFAPSNHGAMMQVDYPSFVKEAGFIQTRRLSVILNGDPDESQFEDTTSINNIDGTVTVTGLTRKASKIIGPTNFATYFVLVVHGGENGDKPLTNKFNSRADGNGIFIDFEASDPIHERLTIRFATSFISLDQAKLNLMSEVGLSTTFEDVKEETKQAWNTVLSRVDIKDTGFESKKENDDVLTTFYSCLYRASLFPRQITEIDSNGTLVHWSPFDPDGKVFEGPLSTDSGFWDAFNTVYPYLSIINRPQLGITLQGWVNAYKEGGWLPTWASPGNRGSMVGTMGDVSFADAIVNKIPGFEVEEGYNAIRKDAFVAPTSADQDVGRTCLESYSSLGFVPRDECGESVSRTLNYIQSDYAIAEAAEFLGKHDDAKILRDRISNYTLQFDPKTAFFRSLDTKYDFLETFDPFSWGGDYVEAGAWQYRFYLPHDPSGLAKLFSDSNLDVCDEIEKAQNMIGTFHIGSYGSEIHEMTEMTEICWGQYEHNNQPVHYMLSMYIALDKNGFSGECSQNAQHWIRKTLNELYLPGATAFPGDEDNGEMAAWYTHLYNSLHNY